MIVTNSISARFLTGFFVFTTAFLPWVWSPSVAAQTPASNSNSATPTPTPAATPIPPSAILAQEEIVTARLKAIQDSLVETPQNIAIRSAVPQLARELESLFTKTSTILAGRPNLDELNDLETEWRAPTKRVDGWTGSLSRQVTDLDKIIEELRAMRAVWQRSLGALTASPVPNANAEAEQAERVPEKLLQRVRDTIAAIETTQKASEDRRSELLTLQSRLGDFDVRIAGAQTAIKDRRTTLLSTLFAREEPAIWGLRADAQGRSISSQIADTMTEGTIAFRVYAAANSERFILHAVLLLIFIAAFTWVRGRISAFAEQDSKVEKASNVFRHPIAAGVVLSIFLSGTIYPQAPKLWTIFLGAVAMIPVVVILRRIVDRLIFHIVCVLAGFYFFDRIREILEGIAILSRVLFLVEMFAAVLLLIILYRSKRLAGHITAGNWGLFKTLRLIAPFAIAIFSAAFIANLVGAVNLSNIIGNGVLQSIYAALIIYTAAEVLDGLTIFALRVRPLSDLGMVKTKRKVMRSRVRQVVQWLGVIFWILIALALFSIRDLVFSFVTDVLSAELKLGSINLTLGHVVAFVIAIWFAVMASRFIRFVLEEDVFPRVDIGTGVSYAISTMVHYVVLTLGLLIAIAALGFELSQFAIIAGAVGIGVGFGLQNIINNFVSGLILLFERPVKVGDTVQIGEQIGTLSQIGLRASVLRKVDGSDVIVPNSQLISEEVVNWTMSDEKRRLDIPVGVAYGTEPQRVLDLLKSVANANEDILVDPPPRALFLAFGESSLDFELRAWTENSDNWVTIRSDLVTAVSNALSDAGIEIPFPQRDLHVRHVDAGSAKEISEKDSELAA